MSEKLSVTERLEFVVELLERIARMRPYTEVGVGEIDDAKEALAAFREIRCETCSAWWEYVASEDITGFCGVHRLVGLPGEAFCSYWRERGLPRAKRHDPR